MKPKITTQYNYVPGTRKEVNLKPSCTIPDQTLSIREIMRRFARGIPLSGNVPVYEDQDSLNTSDGVDFNTLDLSEQYALIEERKAELLKIRKNMESVKISREKQRIIQEYEAQKAKNAAKAVAATGNVSGNEPV